MTFWQILLAVLLLTMGFLGVTNIKIEYSHALIGVLEIGTGILILVKK